MAEQEKYLLEHEKPILEYLKTIDQVKEQNKKNILWTDAELHKLEASFEELKKKVYGALTPWQRVAICRHPSRPHSIDYIRNLCDEFEEIYGDRVFRDDPAVITGFGKIGGEKFVIIAQEKGYDTKSRIERNFGMPHPEGYRKALRAMELAAKFQIPVISFLDTPGAYPGLTAEERGQGWAIAKNLMEMARIATPIIVVLIGEGCSGGALGMGIGDVIGMLEHAYYSVISPEGCASILWKDPSKNAVAAETLKMQSEHLLENEIIDVIIKEPLGGAHHNPSVAYVDVKEFILQQWNILKSLPVDVLLERRYQKFRKMGKVAYEEAPTLGVASSV